MQYKGGAYKMILLNAVSGSTIGFILVYVVFFGIFLIGCIATAVYFLIKAIQKQNKKQ